ncbi:MAG TPA: molecular chaperone DnaK [Polyangiaceae bacterium]|nr:molecular chaperone DnaK [Polyangiaceae bacterium]
MRRVIGIDLGTTNSCVACVEAPAGRAVTAREVRVVPDPEGSRTTPSVVGYLAGGGRSVGHVAKRQAAANAEHTVFAVKRLMGRKCRAPEVQRQASLVPFDVVEAPNGDAWVRVRGRELSPPEVSAHVLEHLREAAEAFLGGRVTDAVIAVPAHFDDAQRQATKDAGRIAGLNVRRILNEPTAAALAYGLDRGRAERIAVYDLGGGTFDVSVLELSAGVFGVKAVGGDGRLGGNDFDDRLLDVLAGEFRREQGVDLRADRAALYRLREAVERAKHELSSALETDVTLPFLTAGPAGPLHLERPVRRSEFEILTRDLVERTLAVCRQTLADARLAPADVENVVLVGGMTRMPAVQRAVRDFFGREPQRGIDPDEVVAVGAALHAAALEGAEGDPLLLDVTPLSIGVETGGGVFTRLIPRNTPIPTERSELFTTSVDDQSFVPVHVLQGERAMAADNQSLARFDLTGIPPAPRGVPMIEVTFKIDVDGLLQVEARDVATGRRQSVVVRPSGGLSRSRIEQLVAEAERLRDDDRRQRSVAELRQRARLLLRSAERAIAAGAPPGAPPGALDEARRLAAALDALAGDEDATPDELGDASDRLERAASWLARPAPER